MAARKTDNGETKTRLGEGLYWAGFGGVALCVLFVIDAVLVHQSGSSFVPIEGRFVSRENIFLIIPIGILLALLSWRGGVAARIHVNNAAEKKRAKANEAGVTVPARDRLGDLDGEEERESEED
ncbi:MAG: hypothetical protein GKS02_00545 [Alphaproteobacteria bacterium]|nr:hypothetical protein [Alphaproteobacteria bacterium]